MKIQFSDRLKQYRESLNLSKRDFAKKLEISESYYNLIENSKRKAPKNVVYKLVELSNFPEEFWLYGISQDEYVEKRDLLKNTKIAIDQILDLNLIKDFDSLFTQNSKNSTVEELLTTALKADISYLIKKE